MGVEPYNIGIQMKRKELTKSFLWFKIKKKNFWFLWFIQDCFRRCKGYGYFHQPQMWYVRPRWSFSYIGMRRHSWRAVSQPFQPSRCIKASFYIPENRLNFHTIKGFRTNISMKLVYQYMAIFFNFKPHQIIFIHYKSRIATSIRGL